MNRLCRSWYVVPLLVWAVLFSGLAVANGAGDLQESIRQLKDKDVQVRINAARALGRSRSAEAVDPLIGRINDSDSRIREAVIDALSSLRAKTAVGPIGKILGSDKTDEVRQTAAMALGAIGDRSAVPALTEALTDPYIGAMLAAIKSLGRLRAVAVTDRFIGMLEETNPTVREYCLDALKKIRDRKVIPSVEKLLKDPVPQVRKKALVVLGAFDAKDSIPKIKKLLSDKNDSVKLAAAYSLGRMKDASGLATAGKFINDKNPQIRRQAIEVYGLVGTRADIPRLKKIKETDTGPHMKRAAERALSLIEQRFPKKSKKKR